MLPLIKTSIPGPKSRRHIRDLHRVECPHITYADADWPVFTERADGANVWDSDGNRFLDLTSAFGVSTLGHRPAALERAIRAQARKMWHGMGDLHPPTIKLECLKRLARHVPKPLSQFIFSSSGSEAIETAFKTAFLATGRPGVIAFKGGYHGLGYGAMQATWRPYFRHPFILQARPFVHFHDYLEEGSAPALIKKAAQDLSWSVKHNRVGAIVIEAIQGRGGVRVADPAFLKMLRRLCDQENIILIFDEIFTGFGRTGKRFAFQYSGVVPDIVTLGKAMANGFPISACAASPQLMKAWGRPEGEAKHTSTFLGNPMGCAMILAVLDEQEKSAYAARVEKLGRYLRKGLQNLAARFPSKVAGIRGRGLMLGMVMKDPRLTPKLIKQGLKRGLILLSSGDRSEALKFTPPVVISTSELQFTLDVLEEILEKA